MVFLAGVEQPKKEMKGDREPSGGDVSFQTGVAEDDFLSDKKTITKRTYVVELGVTNPRTRLVFWLTQTSLVSVTDTL